MACISSGQAARMATSASTPPATAAARTPFAPSAPTPSPGAPGSSGASGQSWPAPNTYGHAPTPAVPVPEPAEPLSFPEGTLNVLLLGSDRRSGIGFRTDTILIASIQPATGLVALVSVPRDLYVYLPGFTVSRINTAWIYGETLGVPGGGPQLLFDTIRYNLGVPIDRYALVEMSGFERIVDLVGGVDVRVACDFTDWRLRRPDLPEQAVSSWALFTVPRGVVHMNGDEALWYARSRSRSSDFDRARRQQEVLRGLYRRGSQPDILTRLPDLYRALQSSVKTDGGLDDLLSLAPFVTSLEPAHIRSRFIGRAQVQSYRVPVSGAAVLLPRPEAIRQVLLDAFAPYPEAEASPLHVDVVAGSDRDLAELAQERLLYAGFHAAIVDDDPTPDGASHVLVSPQAPPGTGPSLLAALGLGPEALASWPAAPPDSAARFQVGEDFDPCFDPSSLSTSG